MVQGRVKHVPYTELPSNSRKVQCIGYSGAEDLCEVIGLDHEHYQLDDGICTSPATFVKKGLQMKR